MLVDLGRNDLGRVSRTGTVRVDSFAHVERYSHVMHLVSNVTGELEPDKDALGVPGGDDETAHTTPFESPDGFRSGWG